jgi:hypothetical protein
MTSQGGRPRPFSRSVRAMPRPPEPSPTPASRAFPHSAAPTAPGRVLGRAARTWRLAVAGVGLTVLLAAQFVDTNDWFPLGSLSQYASAHDPAGTVRSVHLDAVDSTGATVQVPLDPTGVGVGRAEIEGQLGRILADPALLQSIADAHTALHPDEPAYVEIQVVRSTRQLQGGRPVGDAVLETLATWQVQP